MPSRPSADVESAALLHSIPVAAHRLGIGRSLTYELIAAGELETVKIHGRHLVPEDALRAYIARLRSQGAGS